MASDDTWPQTAIEKIMCKIPGTCGKHVLASQGRHNYLHFNNWDVTMAYALGHDRGEHQSLQQLPSSHTQK